MRIVDDVFACYLDEKTGARVYTLTPGPSSDQVVYQTHPMWTPGMSHLVFLSNRSGAAFAPHVLEMKTGQIRPLIDEQSRIYALTWRSSTCYYFDARNLSVVDVMDAFEGRDKGRKIASLPAEYVQIAGGMSVDASGAVVYAGALLEAGKRWGLIACDLKRSEWRTVCTVEFPIGHVQANPFVQGQIMFCHETGGDAPQRMWYVNADGSKLRPFYKETYDEWVTHEVWWGPDHALFTIWPYDREHKEKPHGIACADRDTGTMEIIAQYPAWHTHGTSDHRWVMGDDFDRNIWLLNMAVKERRLLTQGHLGHGFDTHPHGSFTPDGQGIVFTSSRSGSEDVVLVEVSDWESLPLT